MERKYVIGIKCGEKWKYAGYLRDQLGNLYATFVEERKGLEFPSVEAAKRWYHSVNIKNIEDGCQSNTVCVQEKRASYTYDTIEKI